MTHINPEKYLPHTFHIGAITVHCMLRKMKVIYARIQLPLWAQLEMFNFLSIHSKRSRNAKAFWYITSFDRRSPDYFAYCTCHIYYIKHFFSDHFLYRMSRYISRFSKQNDEVKFRCIQDTSKFYFSTVLD